MGVAIQNTPWPGFDHGAEVVRKAYVEVTDLESKLKWWDGVFVKPSNIHCIRLLTLNTDTITIIMRYRRRCHNVSRRYTSSYYTIEIHVRESKVARWYYSLVYECSHHVHNSLFLIAIFIDVMYGPCVTFIY